MKYKPYKIFQNTPPNNFNFILLSILLSIPALLLGNWVVYALPVIFFSTLILIFNDRFFIALILITLFTLVGDLSDSLRSVVHFVDFTLLGVLFLKKYGLAFHSYPRVPKSISIFLILFFFVMFISAAVSNYPFAGVGIISEQIFFFIITYTFYSLIADEQDVKNYVSSIIIVAFIYVIVSLGTFLIKGYGLIDILSQNRIRISVIVTNPEVLTNFYIITMPIFLIVFLTNQRSVYKLLSLITFLIIAIGLVLTMERSAILAIILSSSIIFLTIRRKLFIKFLLSISLIVLIILIYQPLNDLLFLMLRIEEGTSARDKLWMMSINIIQDHPIFGIGPGAYRYEFFNYFPYMLSDWWGRLLIYYYDITYGVNFSHNFFLVLFTEMGILGFIVATLLTIIYFSIGIKTIKKYTNDKKNTYYLIIGLFAIGTSIIFRNFFNSVGLLYLGGLTANLPFWLIFSSLIFFYQQPTSADSLNYLHKKQSWFGL